MYLHTIPFVVIFIMIVIIDIRYLFIEKYDKYKAGFHIVKWGFLIMTSFYVIDHQNEHNKLECPKYQLIQEPVYKKV